MTSKKALVAPEAERWWETAPDHDLNRQDAALVVPLRHTEQPEKKADPPSLLGRSRLPPTPPLPLDPVIILFDLNGTLTSHTSKRRSSGMNKIRPGIEHLWRLCPHFRLGIYSSATERTVSTVHQMLEASASLHRPTSIPASTPLFERNLILDRSRTAPVHEFLDPATIRLLGLKSWDTVKPLGRSFPKLDRVLLIDDDNHKRLEQEKDNTILVPCWPDDEPRDGLLEKLVDLLLGEVLKVANDMGDVRTVTSGITHELQTWWKTTPWGAVGGEGRGYEDLVGLMAHLAT